MKELQSEHKSHPAHWSAQELHWQLRSLVVGLSEASWHQRIKTQLAWTLPETNFMSCVDLKSGAAASADRVSADRQSPAAPALLLLLLSLLLQLLLSFTQILQLLLDG